MSKKAYEQFRPEVGLNVGVKLGEMPARIVADTIRRQFFNELSRVLIKKLGIEIPEGRPFTRTEVMEILDTIAPCLYNEENTLEEAFEGRVDILNYFVIQGLLAVIEEKFQTLPEAMKQHRDSLLAIAHELRIESKDPTDPLANIDEPKPSRVNLSQEADQHVRRILQSNPELLQVLADDEGPLDEVINNWLAKLAQRATENQYLMYALVSGDTATAMALASGVRGALVVGGLEKLPSDYTEQALIEARQTEDSLMGTLALAMLPDSYQSVVALAGGVEDVVVSPRLKGELDDVFTQKSTGG